MRSSRLERVRSFRGCDWFPSWGRSPVDYWTAAMPPDTAARELGFVKGLGLDHVRIWLSAWGYEQDPARYVANLRFVLDNADALGLGVVMELFDSCGCEPAGSGGRTEPAGSGGRTEPAGSGLEQTVPIEDIPSLAAGDPRLATLTDVGRGRDLFGAPGMVPVPWRGDPIVAIWEGFVPNPGYDWIGAEHWPRWDAYATAIVDTVAQHPAMVLLELMNEPFVTQIGTDVDRTPIVEFYRHVHGVVRDRAPDLPLSMGEATVAWFAEHEANLGAEFDVVSFHSLSGADPIRAAIADAVDVAHGRPIYLSEWGYFPGGTDAEQLDEYQRLLPILENAGIGWALSHLIAGYGPFATTAILYPNGVMRPAAAVVRSWLAGKGAAS